MNEQTLKGKWQELKGEIHNTWGKLTGDDLEQTKGNLTAIAGIIHQKYGEAKEEVARKLEELSSRMPQSVQTKIDEVTAATADKSEQVKESLQDSQNKESAQQKTPVL